MPHRSWEGLNGGERWCSEECPARSMHPAEAAVMTVCKKHWSSCSRALLQALGTAAPVGLTLPQGRQAGRWVMEKNEAVTANAKGEWLIPGNRVGGKACGIR